MEQRRRKRKNTRITFLHLLPLIFLGALFVYMVARKGIGRFIPQVDLGGMVTNFERMSRQIGPVEIVAVGVAILVYIYLLPGNAWRLEKFLRPERASRRKRIPSLHGQMDAWQPKLTSESVAAQGFDTQAGVDPPKTEAVR